MDKAAKPPINVGDDAGKAELKLESLAELLYFNPGHPNKLMEAQKLSPTYEALPSQIKVEVDNANQQTDESSQNSPQGKAKGNKTPKSRVYFRRSLSALKKAASDPKQKKLTDYYFSPPSEKNSASTITANKTSLKREKLDSEDEHDIKQLDNLLESINTGDIDDKTLQRKLKLLQKNVDIYTKKPSSSKKLPVRRVLFKD